MTYLLPDRTPPLSPRLVGGKLAVSCHKEREFLIRAWMPLRCCRPERLIDWILHHIGRMDFDGLEWWGATYVGQPDYMRRADWSSGLVIQRYVPPDGLMQRAQDEGRYGFGYGPPEHLEIPEKGIVQAPHNAPIAGASNGREAER